jgi:hypothetical protein
VGAHRSLKDRQTGTFLSAAEINAGPVFRTVALGGK